ncbi:PleD family two-component system response regulator [Sulfitobacter aestuarii]|uniref:PleD family two-component system response regulator n=1 Tax=Sulfitobacter aestuarii TaxID=2161676 RepID=A0ABW5U4W2_9RHOB
MKILAVDDDPIILELLVQFMEAIGDHDLVTANSGQEALEIIKTAEIDRFDCFMLDIQMPAMDGIELAGRIHATARYADAPILMLTAMSEKRYIDSAFAAGATDYVTKPFEISELSARIRVVADLVKARQSRTKKIFSTQALNQRAGENTGTALHEPLTLHDVDNVIECIAMENYVAQLSRSALFGSTVFGFTIRQIEAFHAEMSAFEFRSLIEDTAEVISDTLMGRQFLMSYSGNGTFVCIVESGWRPDMAGLMDQVNLSLSRSELYDNSGQRIEPRVCTGEAIRLVWKTGDQVMDALAQAQASAEQAAINYERSMSDLFQYGRIA